MGVLHIPEIIEVGYHKSTNFKIVSSMSIKTRSKELLIGVVRALRFDLFSNKL